MFWRTVRLACVLGVASLALASACGGSSSNPGTDAGGGNGGKGSTGGSAGKTAMSGAGNAGAAPSMKCGTATCKAVVLPIGDFTIPPCCADEATSQCGLDSSVLSAFGPTFTEACQPLNQPGVLDTECADSAKTPVTGSTLEIQFPGCCRANGTCGYLLDKLGGLFPLGLGCVDSSPFVDGGTPSQCGTGEGGASGAAGASSGGASSGGASSGGASSGGEAGASGASDPGASGEGGTAGA